MHWECKYCDLDFRPIKVEGDLVCEFCGANGKMQKVK